MAWLAGPAAAQALESTSQWTYAGMGASQRLIRIVVDTGACSQLLAPNVEETASTVRITVTARFTGDPAAVCPAIIFFKPLFVPLMAPLAGRKLLGASASSYLLPSPESPPRVVGLSPGDAVTVLRRAYKPVIVRRLGGPGLRRVVAQKGERLIVGGSLNP